MNKNSIIDYISYIFFKIAIILFGLLPKGFSLFLARRLGEIFCWVDLRHKCRVYANIKTAFSGTKPPAELTKITRKFYCAFLQNIIEIFFIPFINKKYLEKYITIEGLENLAEAFKKGKGVIFLAVHSGSWELSNIISANLGFPFNLLVRDQGKFRRVEQLLNIYRQAKGCKIIHRKNQTRQIIEVLKKNEAIGMTVDQGGKSGCLVSFFGRQASMSTGAVRLALKYKSVVLPVYFTRIKGQYVKIHIEPEFRLQDTGEINKDIQDNLQRLVSIFEKYILLYPHEYLWTYKIWKYGKEKEILILNDGKAGHIRQSQAVANIVASCYQDRGIATVIRMQEIKFKQGILCKALLTGSILADRYHCQGCLFCLRYSLDKGVYQSLLNYNPDLIISCGWALAPINYVLSKENQAKSIVIMKPAMLGAKRFNLVIAPRHDRLPEGRNIVVTDAALNLIDDKYLVEQSQRLAKNYSLLTSGSKFYIGVLLGGDTKNFQLKEENVSEVVKGVKSSASQLNADILVTTSRRTSVGIENLLKAEFKDNSYCKLLIIANEKNIPEAVGGILGLSQLIVCSPESISMLSEAINSGKYVLVFESAGLSRKHQRFLEDLRRLKHIHLVKPSEITRNIENILLNKPEIPKLQDNLKVAKAISEIL